MTRCLVAAKPFRYRTRHLQAGDYFEASRQDARALVAVKRANYVDEGRDKATVPAMPAHLRRKAAKRSSKPEAATTLLADPAARTFSPFDHDKDGAPGGSTAPAPSEDLTALRAAYHEKLGKRPFSGWDAEELKRRMGEADPS